MHELEVTQHALLVEQKRARAEIDDLETRAAGLREALEQRNGELGEEEDVALDKALEKDLRALLGARAPGSEKEIAGVVERARQLRTVALERCFAEYRDRVDVLERRLVKLKQSLAHSEEALEKLAEAASEIFKGDDQVEVLAADWSTLRDRGPFSLLFLDAREPKDSGADAIVDLVEPGGVVVLDDFTPCSSWPPVYEGRVDTLREQWLTDERFTTVEVMVAEDASVLIATKR